MSADDDYPQSVPTPPPQGFMAQRLIDLTHRTIEEQQLQDQAPEPGESANETSGELTWELVDDHGNPRLAVSREARETPAWTPERPSDASRAPAAGADGRHTHGLWRRQFLAALKLCPNIRGACEAARVKRGTVDDARERDPVFASQVKAAFRDGVDLLHMAIWQRAVGGVQRPVYQGGVCVGHVVEYSDRLAEFLLRGHAKDSESGTFTDAPMIQVNQVVVASPQAVRERTKALSPIVQRLAAGALRTAGAPVNPLAP